MKCAIYCRKSTDREDKQIQSLHDQIRVLREIATREGLQVVEEFQEAHSAMKPGLRLQFNRMMDLVDAGKIDCVLVYHINRLARNPVDSGRISYALQSGALQSIRTPDRTYLRHDSTLLLSVEYGMATEMSVNLSKTVTERMRMKAERGWLPGKPPFGYLNNYKTREIDPDPETFPIMKRAWELALRGDTPIREIARQLGHLGFKPAIGDWRRTRLLYELFGNPFYSGKFLYKGELFQGKHDPMVSAEEFQRVQRNLNRVNREERKRSKDILHYPGMITCLDCGCGVVGSIVRKKRSDGSSLAFHYYTCTGKRGCRKIGVREEVISDLILRELQRVALPREYTQFLKHLVVEEAERRIVDLARATASSETSIDDLKVKLTRLTQMRLNDEIDAHEYKSLRSQLSTQIEHLENATAASSNATAEALSNVREDVDICARAYDLVFGDCEGSNPRVWAGLFRGMLGFSQGSIRILLNSTIEVIAEFKPRILGSPCPKLGDPLPANSEWYTLADSILSRVYEQEVADAKAQAGVTRTGAQRRILNHHRRMRRNRRTPLDV
jgi:site-specific DNA recombinase